MLTRITVTLVPCARRPPSERGHYANILYSSQLRVMPTYTAMILRSGDICVTAETEPTSGKGIDISTFRLRPCESLPCAQFSSLHSWSCVQRRLAAVSWRNLARVILIATRRGSPSRLSRRSHFTVELITHRTQDTCARRRARAARSTLSVSLRYR